MATTVARANLSAWLDGGMAVPVGADIIRRLPPPPPWPTAGAPEPSLRFPAIEEAAKALASKRLLTPDEYAAASGAARQQGFTFAGIQGKAALGQIRDALVEAVVDGHTLDWFRGEVEHAVGKGALSPSRVEGGFRTGTMASYATGQKRVLAHPLVRSAFQFVWRTEIRDGRLTELCRQLSQSGLPDTNGNRTSVYCLTDPFWLTVAGYPSHFSCRCGGVFISVEQAAEKGIVAAIEWLRLGHPPPPEILYVQNPGITAPKDWVSVWATV